MERCGKVGEEKHTPNKILTCVNLMPGDEDMNSLAETLNKRSRES